MQRLVEIIIIGALSVGHFFSRYPIEFMPVYLMCAVIFSILTELPLLLNKSRNWQLVSVLIYMGLSNLYPPLFLFLPVLLYSVFSRWGIGALLLLFLGGRYPEVMDVVIGGTAVYFSYRCLHFRTYTRQSMKLSDDLKEQMISLERYNTQLLENEIKSREIARLEERNRIAGKLHDYLGHTISSSILQVEALKLTEPDELKKERLQLLQDTLSGGMTDIRRQLHGMYDTSFSLNQKLHELAANTPEIEVKIQNRIVGELSFEKKSDIYTVIREALTNTIKHSDASKFTVFLKEQGKNQVLLITDNGSKEPLEIDPNLGLSGMEDIAQKYQGKLNYYYRQGFCIHMVLPERKIEEKSE